MIVQKIFRKLLISLAFFSSSVFGTPLTFDVSGIQSYGQIGQAENSVFSFDVGPDAVIASVRYNVNMTAAQPSFLSEMGLAFSDVRQLVGVRLTPGAGVDESGTGTYSGFVDLAANELSFSVGADGILFLEFYEALDDGEISPDGIWNFGTITFNFAGDPVDPGTGIPEPASPLLIGAGLAMMGYAGRRRRDNARPLG
jgi:hypothetical protein